VVETKSASLPASGATSVTFNRAPLPAGVSKGRVVLGKDALPVDDAFHFLLGAGGELRVLLIDSSPYVARALEIGEQPRFDVLRRGALSAADLAGRSLAVLGDLGPSGLSPAAGSALARFVHDGGGLIATSPLAGLRGDPAGLLHGVWGESVSRLTDRGASLGFVDMDHPALFVFKQARGFDFSRARFLQYRRFKADAAAKEGETKVLARFDDGREALLESRFGSGRVISFATPLDGVTSDLPVQPLFLPLIHELARYASAHKDASLYRRVGEPLDLGEGDGSKDGAGARSVLSPSGRKRTFPAGEAGMELEEPGFYEVVRSDGASRLIAANLETAESDLTPLDPEELSAALRPAGKGLEPARQVALEEPSERQAWWRAALLAVILLMVAEAFLGSTRGPKTAS
jgi:hypothetical protein